MNYTVKKSIVGIDPGFKGGLAHLWETDQGIKVIASIPMPVFDGGKTEIDRRSVIAFLARANPEKVLIEQVGAMPGQGVTSMFRFGYGAGLLEGISFGLGFPVELVRPQAWQAKVLAGYPRMGKGKSSVLFCQREFPDISLLATERSKVPHDGISDSIAIAYYGITKNN